MKIKIVYKQQKKLCKPFFIKKMHLHGSKDSKHINCYKEEKSKSLTKSLSLTKKKRTKNQRFFFYWEKIEMLLVTLAVTNAQKHLRSGKLRGRMAI